MQVLKQMHVCFGNGRKKYLNPTNYTRSSALRNHTGSRDPHAVHTGTFILPSHAQMPMTCLQAAGARN